MGLCASSENSGANSAEAAEARKRSKGVEKALRDESEKDKAVNKLLLLGAGESGKSTLFKQMISIYGKGFSEEDRKGFRSVIHNNILTSMRTLLEQVEKMAEHGIDASIKQDLVPSANYVLELKTTDLNEISPDLALHLAALWLDPGVQTVYANRSKFQLTDSCAYFLDKVVECAEPNYIPSSEDVLHSRVRTTGIVENTFVIEENEFKMYDVGGQRNERKKWIHCFEEVTAVLFAAALSEYDLRLFEDENVNRMTEAITLFADIVNSRWFKNSAMILLLNKTDLFEKKIEIVPITVCFPEYTGPGDSTSAAGFIEQQFRNQVKDPKKPIYVYFTNATNTNMMRNVFSAVKDIVIRKSLQEGGLLG